MGDTLNTASVVNSLISEQFKTDTTSYNISKNENNQTVESIEVIGTAFNARLYRLLSDDPIPVDSEIYIEYQPYNGSPRRMIAFDGNPPCDPEILKVNLCDRPPYFEISDDVCMSAYDDLSRCGEELDILYGDEGNAVSILFADTAAAAATYYSTFLRGSADIDKIYYEKEMKIDDKGVVHQNRISSYYSNPSDPTPTIAVNVIDAGSDYLTDGMAVFFDDSSFVVPERSDYTQEALSSFDFLWMRPDNDVYVYSTRTKPGRVVVDICEEFNKGAKLFYYYSQKEGLKIAKAEVDGYVSAIIFDGNLHLEVKPGVAENCGK